MNLKFSSKELLSIYFDINLSNFKNTAIALTSLQWRYFCCSFFITLDLMKNKFNIQVTLMSDHITTNYPPLEKHTYPRPIKILGLITGALFLLLVPRFLLIDLPHHREAGKLIREANIFFERKDYFSAISAYGQIATKYPNFGTVKSDAKIKFVKSLFALTSEHEDLYEIGLNYLAEQEYKTSEIRQMREFLPKMYKEDFMSRFERA
ncbi:MAG TPA: hypothetical protein VGT41_04125 [Candidatus Babeliales bacterium]|nr:hypothetical protein [Candidatus Babeliales bacterium]